MFATISCSCCNGASWPDPVMLKLVYIPYVLFSYIIHTHTWVLCPWCVCVCVWLQSPVSVDRRKVGWGHRQAEHKASEKIKWQKVTWRKSEHTHERTRERRKIISRLCRPKLETLCRYITRFLATCVCPPIAEGHQRISCLLKPRRRTRAGWYGPIKRKKYRSYHRVLLWLSARPALVSLVLTFAFCVWDYVICTSAGVSHSLNFSLTPVIAFAVFPIFVLTGWQSLSNLSSKSPFHNSNIVSVLRKASRLA